MRSERGTGAVAEVAEVHVVVHTHWDREWYLPFESFRARLVRLVDGLLDLLEREPGFASFMLDGQTVVLDDYLEMRPGNADRLGRLVAAGRLLVGPWYVLPDEMLVSGESLVRNLARGRARAQALGRVLPVGYVPDQFSHSADLPTILRGFGLESACLWRGVGPGVGTQAFRWRSPAGAEVLTAYLATGYANAATLFDEPEETAAKLAEAVEALRPYAVVPCYLLLNGDDHRFPVAEAPRLLAAAAGGGASARLSSLPAYLAELRRQLASRQKDLPLVTSELRSGYRAPVLVGTFSSRIRQKQRCHRLETLLTRTAEPLATMVWLLGAAPYPGAELDYAWRLLLQNQPHDSICGCSVDTVHREIEVRYDKAEQVAAEVVEHALRALREYLDPGPGVVTVVNTDLSPADGLVEVTVPGTGDLPRLLDAEGREVELQPAAGGSEDVVYDFTLSPAQLKALLPFIASRRVQGMFVNAVDLTRPSPDEVRLEALVGDRPVGEFDWRAAKAEISRHLADRGVLRFHVVARRSPRRRLAFVARGVPGLGWKQYRLVTAATGALGTDLTDRVRVLGPNSLENAFYRVRVNPDGTLDVTDKTGGRTLRGLNRLVDGGDRGDLYTYCPPAADTVVDRPLRPAKVRIAESGPVRATLEVTALYRLPPGLASDRGRRRRPRRRDPILTVTTRVSLVAGERLVRLVTSFDNRAADHRLQAVFPVGEAFDVHYALSHFSVVERPAREPVDDPASWSEPPSGIWPHRGFFGAGSLTVFTKGLPEYTVMGAAESAASTASSAAGGAAAAADRGRRAAPRGSVVPLDVSRQPAGPGLALGLTLVRSVGWLSREDLPARPGHAGPALETPEGQCPGPQRLEYALAVGAKEEAVALHRRYTAGLLALDGVVPPDGGPRLPELSEGSLLEVIAEGAGGPGVVAGAVKKADQPEGPAGPAGSAGPAGPTVPAPDRLVVRLVNYSGREAVVSFRSFRPGRSARASGGALWGATDPGPTEAGSTGLVPLDLGESPVGPPAADWTVRLAPWQVATYGIEAATCRGGAGRRPSGRPPAGPPSAGAQEDSSRSAENRSS